MFRASRAKSAFLPTLLSTLMLGSLGTWNSATARAGIDGQIGHTALPALGRNTSISQFEIFPYHMIEDEQILFGDVRGFISNYGKVGGNIGGGYRFLEPNQIFILGVNGFYDVDQTSGETFQQLGYGFEALTRFGGLTSNFYFPIGEDEKTMRRYTSDARFQGNQIVFDNQHILGQAMKGMDLTLSAFVPGEFAETRNIEVSAGWYFFQGNNVDNINGFKLQVEGEVVPTINAQVAVTNDGYFGTNTTIGLSWRFTNQSQPDSNLDRQFRRFVDRNYNVIVNEWALSGTDIPLINPETGLAYTVQHVAENATGGTGDYDNPWSSLADAQAAGGDVIFVHQGSTLSESITLADGQFLLGEGVEHQFMDQNHGLVTLATNDDATGPLPTLLNGSVTMADGSQVAGFNLNSSTGSAIIANGITDFTIRDVTINNAMGHAIEIANMGESAVGTLENILINGGLQDGLHITNIDGELTLDNITVDGAADNGVYISGGKGQINFTNDLTLSNVQGTSLYISDLITTSVVDGKGTTETTDDETIITEGTVSIENLLISAADWGTGIELHDNHGFVSIDNAEVSTRNGSALVTRNSDTTENQWVYIGKGNLSSTNAPVIDVEDSRIDLRLTSVNADGGIYGIRMVDTKGRLIIFGNGTENSGGVIKNTETAIHMENSQQVSMQSVHFQGNDTVAVIQNSEIFEWASVKVTETNTQFIDALNLKQLIITGTLFEDNTLTADTGIEFNVNTTGGFIASFNQNKVTEGPRRLFHATTLTGGEGASLTHSFQANAIALDHAFGVASSVDWTGSMQSTVRNNLIMGYADNQTAFRYNAGDSNSNFVLAMSQNGIGLAGANGTGIELVGSAPVTAQITQNLIEFNDIDGTGIKLSTSKASTLVVSQNEINDYAGGATGILFPTVYDGSTVTLNSNYISLVGANTKGIIFQDVGGVDSPFIHLISTSSNTITGASELYSRPAGKTTGQVIINGTAVQ